MSRIYEALQKAEAEKAEAMRSRTANGLTGAPSESSDEPEISQGNSHMRLPVNAASAQTLPNGARTPKSGVCEIPTHPWNPSLAHLPALLNNGAPVEQFRSLRSRLFELRTKHRLKSILISSGVAQEGKSFVAVNLAISLARSKNSRVLLIDGDMRRCTLHTLLGCGSQPGLPDFLSGRVGAFEVMQRPDTTGLVTGVPQQVLQNLTFIAGGNSGEEAADLSGTPRFQELIATAESEFEWIIVDSSPVVPVSDAVNLARACDAVLLIARGGVTPYEVAQRAQSEFNASKILGFVLNGADAAPSNSQYYGYSSSNT
jgi:capsular exopolysaccharide synthesis family protein